MASTPVSMVNTDSTLTHRRDRAGRAPVDPSCLGRHCRLSHRGGPRRRLRRAPHRHQHRQRQAPVEFAPLAPAGDQAQRAVPAADRPDRRGHRRDDAGSGRRSGERAGHGAGPSDKCFPQRHSAGRRRILRPQRRLVPERRRPAQEHGSADQSGAFLRHARPRSDFARDPRRDLAIARRRSAQENDVRRHRASGLRHR